MIGDSHERVFNTAALIGLGLSQASAANRARQEFDAYTRNQAAAQAVVVAEVHRLRDALRREQQAYQRAVNALSDAQLEIRSLRLAQSR